MKVIKSTSSLLIYHIQINTVILSNIQLIWLIYPRKESAQVCQLHKLSLILLYLTISRCNKCMLRTCIISGTNAQEFLKWTLQLDLKDGENLNIQPTPNNSSSPSTNNYMTRKPSSLNPKRNQFSEATSTSLQTTSYIFWLKITQKNPKE